MELPLKILYLFMAMITVAACGQTFSQKQFELEQKRASTQKVAPSIEQARQRVIEAIEARKAREYAACPEECQAKKEAEREQALKLEKERAQRTAAAIRERKAEYERIAAKYEAEQEQALKWRRQPGQRTTAHIRERNNQKCATAQNEYNKAIQEFEAARISYNRWKTARALSSGSGLVGTFNRFTTSGEMANARQRMEFAREKMDDARYKLRNCD